MGRVGFLISRVVGGVTRHVLIIRKTPIPRWLYLQGYHYLLSYAYISKPPPLLLFQPHHLRLIILLRMLLYICFFLQFSSILRFYFILAISTTLPLDMAHSLLFSMMLHFSRKCSIFLDFLKFWHVCCHWFPHNFHHK